jgi:endo-1,4-beta-D-glucanase Y
MFSKTKIVVGAVMVSTFSLFAQSRPFPQAGNFETAEKMIKPNNRTQEQLNQDVIDKFNDYKNSFLKEANYKKFYYISARGTGEDGARCVTQSEAHGYGMIIFALMGDRKVFDGMNELRKAQPSTGNPALMSWVVFPESVDLDNPPAEFRRNSATDGDLDMAYALLLAYKQWGDKAYLDEAKTIIAAIKQSSMGANSRRTTLGDWSESELNTRNSDWMAGHFRAFYGATKDSFWLEAADTVYSLLKQVSDKNTGLMPDFVTGDPAVADPTGGGTTGEFFQQYYSYNGCRVPWRLALDYAHNGTKAAKLQIDKISAWLKEKTGANPSKIKSGYTLDGKVLEGRDYTDIAFIAPFASGMITNTKNQSFLNDTYAFIINVNPNNAYASALQLLNMLLITGNWWAP